MTIKTKIMATIGPASGDESTIRKMIGAGMDAARLNFSHGDHSSHGAVIDSIRRAEAAMDKPIAIHADLSGPKIRTGSLPRGMPIKLNAGDEVVFAPEGTAREGEIPITFRHLAKDVRRGSRILIDDGHISVEVKSASGDRIRAAVVDGGVLREHKGINLPGIALSTSAITERDADDLKFALSKEVDSIGVSFVQGGRDISRVRKTMEEYGRTVPIVAKIERQAALANMDEITAASDALMVARGDLGVETPIEEVPIIQKGIIERGFLSKKPVIVATQMLESMKDEARPTRAEVSDVANSVFDGADIVMLSSETSVGHDPAGAVSMMRTIIGASERSNYAHHGSYELEPDDSAVTATTRAACFAAEEAKAKAICVFTMTGRSALLVSKQRPSSNIIAIAHSDGVARRLALYWGVAPIKIRKWKSIGTMIEKGIEAIKSSRFVKKGDKVVIVCGTATAPGATNMMTVHEVR